MILAHRAMLCDLSRIADTAGSLTQRPVPGRPSGLQAYGLRITEIIEHHHQGEDDIIWPELSRRGADAEALALLQKEHDDLQRHQTDLHDALKALTEDGGGAEAVEKAARATHDALGTHTRDEERELTGRLAPALDADLWKRFEGGMVKSAARWTLWFMPPWLSSVAGPGEEGGIPARPMAALMAGRLRRHREAAFGSA
ncbi:hemerythrin domain-containing protein [Streptomyces sp. AJS327]|nr:hemerythrin domain-containing protein [Streptomyces sp. AJS327]